MTLSAGQSERTNVRVHAYAKIKMEHWKFIDKNYWIGSWRLYLLKLSLTDQRVC